MGRNIIPLGGASTACAQFGCSGDQLLARPPVTRAEVSGCAPHSAIPSFRWSTLRMAYRAAYGSETAGEARRERTDGPLGAR